MDKSEISVIIPVYNESAGIGKLLEYLSPMRGQCEIIFVDGGSSDDTVTQIEQAGHQAVRSPQKGRANQMNYGASLSNGEILWFLHADSIPPADALAQIRETLAKGREIGCFNIRFDSRHPLMLLTAFLSNNLRARCFSIAFGDQGIFIRQGLFEKLGGYAAIPLMEDYQLSLDARAAGYRIGMATGSITTSSRRYQLHGHLRTILQMWILQCRFRLGASPEELAAAYDDTKRRRTKP